MLFIGILTELAMHATVGFLIVLGLLWATAKLADRFPKQCDAVYCFFKEYGCLILLLIFGFLSISGFWFFFSNHDFISSFCCDGALRLSFAIPIEWRRQAVSSLH